MEKSEFLHKINKKMEKLDICLNEKQLEQFFMYKDLLITWNEKMNLTAIKDEDEIITKHFIDSLTIANKIGKEDKVIDIGTGAGFPGIPLKIFKEDISVTLLDSLNKRISFLQEVINKLELKDICAIHGRAEEIARNEKYREKYDVATSRAVAPIHTLLEYMLPYVKVGGKCICMKGPNLEEENKDLENCLSILGGKIEKIEEIVLPETDIRRNIMIINKIKSTPKKYPRNPGIPTKKPL